MVLADCQGKHVYVNKNAPGAPIVWVCRKCGKPRPK